MQHAILVKGQLVRICPPDTTLEQAKAEAESIRVIHETNNQYFGVYPYAVDVKVVTA